DAAGWPHPPGPDRRRQAWARLDGRAHARGGPPRDGGPDGEHLRRARRRRGAAARADGLARGFRADGRQVRRPARRPLRPRDDPGAERPQDPDPPSRDPGDLHERGGRALSAGPTPMRIRHDALVAAAQVVTGVRRIAHEIGGDLVTTVGRLTVSPNIVNAIPGKVALSIDMRDPKNETLDRTLPLVDGVVRDACEREGVRYELEHYWRVPFTRFASDVDGAVERAAKTGG